MHDQVLTTTGFCTVSLARKPLQTIDELVSHAHGSRLKFDEYQVRRAIKSLVDRRLVVHEHGGHTTKLKYKLTTRGKARAEDHEEVIRDVFEIDRHRSPKHKGESKSANNTVEDDNVGMDEGTGSE